MPLVDTANKYPWHRPYRPRQVPPVARPDPQAEEDAIARHRQPTPTKENPQ